MQRLSEGDHPCSTSPSAGNQVDGSFSAIFEILIFGSFEVLNFCYFSDLDSKTSHTTFWEDEKMFF